MPKTPRTPASPSGRGLSHIRAEIARLRDLDFTCDPEEIAVRTAMVESFTQLHGASRNIYNHKVTWRFKMMLHAIGAETVDGADLPDEDYALLVLLDCYLIRRAEQEGQEAAERSLYAVVRILETEDEPFSATVH